MIYKFKIKTNKFNIKNLSHETKVAGRIKFKRER